MDLLVKYREVLEGLLPVFPRPNSLDDLHLTLFGLPSFPAERIHDVHFESGLGRLEVIQPETSILERVWHSEKGLALQLPRIDRHTKELKPDSPIIRAVPDELPFRCGSLDRMGLDGETYRLVFTFNTGVHEAEIWEPFSSESTAWVNLIQVVQESANPLRPE